MTNRREFLQLTSYGAAGVAAAGLAGSAEAAVPRYVVPAQVPSLPIVGSSARFPIRRIYCMGLNYHAHVAEGRDGFKTVPPFFFLKAANQVVQNNSTIEYPQKTQDFEHEIELVVAIKTGGKDIPVEQALSHVYGYAAGLDMTRRDLQKASIEGRMPWEPGKSFDEAAPMTAIVPVAKSGHFDQGSIRCQVNGVVRQDGNISDMIFDVAHLINFLSTYQELQSGDLIMTGTPAGSAAVVSGDRMIGTIDRLPTLTIDVR